MVFRSFIITVVLLFLASQGLAQTYPFTSYTTADGLAQASVSCVLQDSRGSIWFGTWGGISNYDGDTFWSYRNSGLHVTCLSEDKNRTLWIGTSSGLAQLAHGDTTVRWVTPSSNLLPSSVILHLLHDRAGNMWVGTDNGLVVFTASGKRIVLTRGRDIQHDFISSISQDSTGAILISSGGGLLRCRLNDTTLTEKQELLKGTITGAMIVLRNGDILAHAVELKTVLRYHSGAWHAEYKEPAEGSQRSVRSLGEDLEGGLWIGTTAGLIVLENGTATTISRSHGLPNQYIGSIFRDREGILWFGTEEGALKHTTTMFRRYNYTSGLPDDHVIATFQDQNKNLWFGTYAGAAMVRPGGRVTLFDHRDGIPHPSVHSFAQGKNGRVWIATWDGLVVYDNGRLKRSPIPALQRGNVIRLLNDPDGTIWCGGHQLLLKASADGKVLLSLTSNDGIPPSGISALFLDADHTIWFGTDAAGGGYYREGKVVLLGSAEGLPDPWVRAINQDRHGTIWFATSRGAVSWNGTRFEPIQTSADELGNGIVTFVVKDSLHNMWFGTQRGVFVWNDSVVGQLDKADGLVADPTRCGYVDGEGNLLVGTVGGTTQLRMHSFNNHQPPPPLSIEGLGTDRDPASTLRTSFSHNDNTLTMHFNSLSFLDERRTEFQWRLIGFDPSWNAPRNDRSVRYTHLPSGNYDFVVRARNRRSAWSEPVHARFVIHSPFWATWWFIALSSASVAGVLLLLFKRRVQKLEKEKSEEQKFSRQLLESQEQERKRIAGELHDSLVQNLLVAKNRSLLGMKNSTDAKRMAKELSEISDALGDAIEEVRELAHNLRPYQLDRLGLTQALHSLARQMSGASTTTFATDIENIDALLTPDAATIVYRIIQELTNNILKHSGASKASIVTRRKPADVEISVKDNGRGYSNQETHGFGLTGIEQRVRMLGGTLSVSPSPGTGTTVQFTIPISLQHS